MEIMSFLISVPAPYAHIICGWRDYKVVHLVVDLLQKLINLATHHYIIASVPCSGISFLGVGGQGFFLPRLMGGGLVVGLTVTSVSGYIKTLFRLCAVAAETGNILS